MKQFTFIVLIIWFFSSCQSEKGDQTVTFKNKYTLTVPSSFSLDSTYLNGSYSLLLENPRKDFYIHIIDKSNTELQIILDENSLNEVYSNDLIAYSELILSLHENTIFYISEIIDTQINNMPARLLTTRERMGGDEVFYSLAFFQGKNRYYSIQASTLLNRENEHKDQMKRIMYTLKEL